MSNKLNRNINTAFSGFTLPNEKDGYLKNNNKDNFKEFLRTDNNSRNTFDFQIKNEGDRTVDSDIESIILDLKNLGGLSSSSSLSWSDDYETETTKKVYDELKKLDRVLKGEEPIPSYYNKEECLEWMQNFSYLSIFDDDKTPTNSIENLSSHRNINQFKDMLLHYDFEISLASDKKSTLTNESNQKKKKPNEEIPNFNQKRLIRGQNCMINNNNNLFVVSKPRSLDVDQYLKVSPVLHSKRKQSSKSLLNRQISRESPDNHLEYSSLPHIKIESLPTLKLQKSSQQIRKQSTYSKTGRNDNHLILPALDIEQFRSVSAIPNENFKTLSALSVNLNNKQKIRKKKYSSETVKNVLNYKRPSIFFCE